MNSLRDEFDAFPISIDAARTLDRWCDNLESALRHDQTIDLVGWIERLPAEIQPHGIAHALEIDQSLAIERQSKARSLATYQQLLPSYSELLAKLWQQLTASTNADPSRCSTADIKWPERFRIIRPLGHGGMGEVFLVEHLLLGRQVAVKVLQQPLRDFEAAVERFRAEIRTLAALKHPGLAAAVDADVIDGHVLLVMEYVSGLTLLEIVRNHGPFSWTEACDYCHQLAQTLEYAHAQGVVHRDVKPGNVMRDENQKIRLLDLGLARFVNDTGDNRDASQTAFSGTPDFAAPEQQLSLKPDPRADIYGLGATLYYLIRAKVMYPAQTCREKLRLHREGAIPTLSDSNEIPAELEQLFRRMVAKTAHQRPDNMSDVKRALELLIQRHRRTAGPRKVSGRRLKTFVLAGIVLLIASGGAWGVLRKFTAANWKAVSDMDGQFHLRTGDANRLGEVSLSKRPVRKFGNQSSFAPDLIDVSRIEGLIVWHSFDRDQVQETENGAAALNLVAQDAPSILMGDVRFENDGLGGQCVAFDGQSHVALARGQIRGKLAFTIAAWVKLNTCDGEPYLYHENVGPGLEDPVFAMGFVDPAGIRLSAFNSQAAENKWSHAAVRNVVPLNEWCFVALRWGKGTKRTASYTIDDKTYDIDFCEVSQPHESSAQLGIGLTGLMDEFLLFDRMLNDAELELLKTRGRNLLAVDHRTRL